MKHAFAPRIIQCNSAAMMHQLNSGFCSWEVGRNLAFCNIFVLFQYLQAKYRYREHSCAESYYNSLYYEVGFINAY